nr:DUF4158 domain-containing protein [Micromonospora sp. KC721]
MTVDAQVAGYVGWRSMDTAEWKDLDEFLFARAMEHDSPKLLFRLACEYLLSSRVIRPGVILLLRRVAAARARARTETWSRVRHLLTDRRCAELDLLLVPDAYRGRTPLAWLGVGPTSSSPAAVKTELEKLAYLRRLDAHTLDLSMLPAERRRFLAGVGRRLTGQALQRREPERRYPILLTLLAQSAVDVLDETLLLFDQAISGREAAAKQKVAEALAERAKGGENRQALLDEILTIVLDPGIGDEQTGTMLRTIAGRAVRHRARKRSRPALRSGRADDVGRLSRGRGAGRRRHRVPPVTGSWPCWSVCATGCALATCSFPARAGTQIRRRSCSRRRRGCCRRWSSATWSASAARPRTRSRRPTTSCTPPLADLLAKGNPGEVRLTKTAT